MHVNGKPRILVYGTDLAALDPLISSIQSVVPAHIEKDYLENFLATPDKANRAGLVILDLAGGDPLTDPRLSQARERLGTSPLVVISDELVPDLARHLVRLKANDWILRNHSQDELAKAVSQITSAPPETSAKVTTVIGASGGVGTTTLALQAAYWLATSGAKNETALVDLDFQAANCSAYLNAPNGFDLDAIVASPQRLDAELLEAIRIRRDPGLALYSFERPDLITSQHGKSFVLRLLDLAAAKHRQVVIDLPNLPLPWFADVVANSDVIYAVFEPNVPCLHQARRLVQTLEKTRNQSSRLVPIANKTKFKIFGNSISKKAIEKMVSTRRLPTISHDAGLFLDALNRGLFPSEVQPRARPLKDMEKLFGDTLN